MFYCFLPSSSLPGYFSSLYKYNVSQLANENGAICSQNCARIWKGRDQKTFFAGWEHITFYIETTLFCKQEDCTRPEILKLPVYCI